MEAIRCFSCDSTPKIVWGTMFLSQFHQQWVCYENNTDSLLHGCFDLRSLLPTGALLCISNEPFYLRHKKHRVVYYCFSNNPIPLLSFPCSVIYTSHTVKVSFSFFVHLVSAFWFLLGFLISYHAGVDSTRKRISIC